MFFLFLLSILGASALADPLLQTADVSATATCTATQANMTNMCLVQYFSNFGTISPFTFDNFQTIANKYIQQNGFLGFELACKWYNAIAPCIAPSGANLSTCLTNDNFAMWFNTSQMDSIMFRTSLFQAQFECNAGYQVAIDNYNCLFNVSDAQQNALNNCFTTYNNSLSGPQPDVCGAYNTYIQCTEKLYNTYCGPQVQPWLCNIEEIGMQVNYQGCNSVLPQCGAAYQNTSTCTIQQANATKQCFQAYFNNYGNISPFNYYNFEVAFGTYINNTGSAGLQNICSWQNAIAPCVAAAGANLSACLTNENFAVWFQTNYTDSISFRTLYYESVYECNDGYQLAMDNFQCLFQPSPNQVYELNTCYNTYMNQVNGVTNGSAICGPYNDLMTCTETSYNKYCGAQIQPWMCKIEEIGLQVNYQGCNSGLQQCNAAYQNTSSCTIAQASATRQCFQSYFSNFGQISPFNFYNFEVAWANYVNKSGVAGFNQTCSWQNAIAPCVSAAGANLSACLTNENFAVWFQTNSTDSIAFRTFYYESAYECNDGLKVATDNFQCLFQPSASQQSDLNNCLSHYNTRIANTSDVCIAFNDYMICTENTYKNNPMCGNAVQPWLCKVEEIGMQVNYQGCNSILQDCSSLNKGTASSNFIIGSLVAVLSAFFML